MLLICFNFFLTIFHFQFEFSDWIWFMWMWKICIRGHFILIGGDCGFGFYLQCGLIWDNITLVMEMVFEVGSLMLVGSYRLTIFRLNRNFVHKLHLCCFIETVSINVDIMQGMMNDWIWNQINWALHFQSDFAQFLFLIVRLIGGAIYLL